MAHRAKIWPEIGAIVHEARYPRILLLILALSSSDSRLTLYRADFPRNLISLIILTARVIR